MHRKLAQQQAWGLTRPVAVLLDLLYPPRCINCGRVDTPWCAVCQENFRQLPLVNPVAARQLHPMQAVATTAIHDGQLQHMIHALKYENATYLAPSLGERLAKQAQIERWAVDGVISVPLHMTRYRERGYNQAKLLADEVAGLLGLPSLDGALLRDSFTRSQVGLGKAERQQNVAGAFHAVPHLVEGHRLILVDDVLTTGSTLQACATALIAGGAAAVYGLTVTTAK